MRFAAAFLALIGLAASGASAAAQIERPLATAGCAGLAAVLYDGCRVTRVFDCGGPDRVFVYYENGAALEVEEREDGVLMTRWRDEGSGRGERFWSLDGLRGRDLLTLAAGDRRAHRFGYRTEPDGAEGEADQIFIGGGGDVLELPSGALEIVALRDRTIWGGGRELRAERLVSTKLGAVVGMIVYGEDGAPVVDRTPIDVIGADDPRFEFVGAGACGGVS